MATLISRLNDVVVAVGADIKALFARTLPAGGLAGQTPVKTSDNDFDASWQTQAAGGGGSSEPSISPFLLMGS